MLIRILALPMMLLALAGCSTQQEKLGAWAQANNAKTEVIHTSTFPIQTLTPGGFTPGKRLTVFIEGDGRAWATSTQPSLDPTPHVFSVASLAIKSHPGVYLARPCQFVMNSGCDKSMWTDARFNRSAVEATNEAIDVLKARYKASSIELIGYSGGAAIALLVAGQRNDVTQLQTISGNVDPMAWVALKSLSPLKWSLDPLTNLENLSKIPQRHFVGQGDKVIPKTLAQGFVSKISARCAEIVELSGDHASLVATLNSETLNKPIACGYR